MNRFQRLNSILFISFLSAVLFVYPQAQLQVGYAVLSSAPASNRPSGMALFTYSNTDGVVLWQAGVGAVEPIRSGRIFVDRTGGTRTAVALANPSNQQVGVKLVLRDSSGLEAGSVYQTLNPYEHVPRFVDELIPGIPESLKTGSLTFETVNSDHRVAAITLRANSNWREEPLYATLPVADMDAAASKLPLTFPQVAIGGDYTTQIVLVSRSSQPVQGKIRMFRSDGTPFQLAAGSEIAYQIEAHGAYRLELNQDGPVQAGYAIVSLEQGDAIPSGTVIFQIKSQGKLMTEAGVAAIPATTKARIFIDRAGTETGIAVASPDNPAAVMTLEWLDRVGRPLGTTEVNLPAGGHLAKFAWEMYPDLPEGSTGILEIRSPVPIVPIALMLTNNKRDDLILTTMPVADVTRPTGDKTVVFPQIAFGSGYETRLILINTETDRDATVNLSFYQSNGLPLTVPLAGASDSHFAVQMLGGSARQLRPGNVATVKEVVPDLRDPGGSEIAVNEGSSVFLDPVALDSAGVVRDDFQFAYACTNTGTASVDAQGKITGRQAGFSTLVISTGSVVKTATICVVGVNSNVTGYEIPGEIVGVAQDRANRVYMANATDQTVLLARSVTATPERYAGVSQSAGLKNDVRLQSLFKHPSFLAVDELNKLLYVSDGGNNVIRRVIGGEPGNVDTLSTDLSWNNPQGLSLDTNGYLWVSDTGSHTVRRISLKDGKANIVAGSTGSAGFADGTGNQARFSSPAGIALEPEPLVAQLERERTGAPPPPVSVIVVDSGNNQVRRVTADGVVTTVGRLAADTAPAGLGGSERRNAAPFNGPVGVALDAAGNIYVSEPENNKVKLLLASTGRLVQAVQSGTLVNPRGLAVGQNGRVLVGTRLRAAQEIYYGQPAIANVSPGTIPALGGVRVTITGRNFSPETVVTAGGRSIGGLEIRDTETMTFMAPSLPSGRLILSVQNRGGLAQQALLIEPKSLADLPAGSITTVAGGSTYSGEGGSATSACIGDPLSLALDSQGNLYMSSHLNQRIFKIDRLTGVLTAVAGTGTVGGLFGDRGDGQLATAAQFFFPSGIAVDQFGNLFIADQDRVRRVDSGTGIITTVAGGGLDHGDGVPATSASLFASGIWVDASGNIFVAAGTDDRVRKVDASGIITTVAGTGQSGFGGDGEPATAATLDNPTNVVGDRSGNIYIADTSNNRIRKVDARGVISTIAGNGECGYSGDGGPALTASICQPGQIGVDGAGDLYFASAGNERIRKIDTAGIITTVAGNGGVGFSGDGGPATEATFWRPEALAVDSAGQIFIGDRFNYRIRLVDAGGRISTIAGNGAFRLWGDGEVAWAATFYYLGGITSDAAGNVYVADLLGDRIRKVDGKTGIITTAAGGGESFDNNVPATEASLLPNAVAVDSAGNLLIADGSRIRRVDAASKMITTIAGAGVSSLDNILASKAKLDSIYGIAVDGQDNLFITQSTSNKIRKIDHASGIITTVAGNGQSGYSGDGGPATEASLDSPEAVAVDRAGNIYIADKYNHRVRRVSAGGIITTVAGNGNSWSFPLAGGPATQISLDWPESVAVDSSGNVFISDWDNRVVRVDAVTGNLTTIAGAWYFGQRGFGGDGGPATAASLGVPYGLAFDRVGNLLISDHFNARIRAVKGPFPIPPPAGPSCDLFSDSFAGGEMSGWEVSSDNATWQISNGKLQVSNILEGKVASASHALPASGYFRLSMDVDAETPGEGGYGFLVEPLNQSLTIGASSGATYTVSGIGAWVTGSSKVG